MAPQTIIGVWGLVWGTDTSANSPTKILLGPLRGMPAGYEHKHGKERESRVTYTPLAPPPALPGVGGCEDRRYEAAQGWSEGITHTKLRWRPTATTTIISVRLQPAGVVV